MLYSEKVGKKVGTNSGIPDLWQRLQSQIDNIAGKSGGCYCLSRGKPGYHSPCESPSAGRVPYLALRRASDFALPVVVPGGIFLPTCINSVSALHCARHCVRRDNPKALELWFSPARERAHTRRTKTQGFFVWFFRIADQSLLRGKWDSEPSRE